MKQIYSILVILAAASVSYASDPVVGREAAQKYFQKKSDDVSYESNGGDSMFGTKSSYGTDKYLALHYGRYMSSQSYSWDGRGNVEDVGKNQFGLTYKVSDAYDSIDVAIRVDYSEYSLDDSKPTKLSFIPIITFPQARSGFPLYFGLGAGLGVFLKQESSKSAISFDYQLFAGARFFNVFENTGFFIEAGLKNHLHLLSTGQFNGTFLATGLVFTF